MLSYHISKSKGAYLLKFDYVLTVVYEFSDELREEWEIGEGLKWGLFAEILLRAKWVGLN